MTPIEPPNILSDDPIEDHEAQFNFEEFARTLAYLIASRKTKTPLTIGISGPWGSGKTTLLNRIKCYLRNTLSFRDKSGSEKTGFANPKDDPSKVFRVCYSVWFNAWKYSNEDEILVALIREIVSAMKHDGYIIKHRAEILDPLKSYEPVFNTFLNWLTAKTPLGPIGNMVPQPTTLAQKTATLDLFNDGFERLSRAWIMQGEAIDVDEKGTIVVFIDDLDRCSPERAFNILEAIKLFMDKHGCIFVLGADITVVQKYIEKQFQQSDVPEEIARNYIEKLVNIKFEIPPVQLDDMADYLRGLSKGKSLNWGNSWKLMILATDANPRKAKILINDINLGWAMFVNSGRANGRVRQDDFNTWQVLWRSAPPEFITHISDQLTDKQLRFDYLMDMLAYVHNSRAGAGLGNSFKFLEEHWQFKRLLGDVCFTHEFTPEILDAFLHLAIFDNYQQPPSTNSAGTPNPSADELPAGANIGGPTPPPVAPQPPAEPEPGSIEISSHEKKIPPARLQIPTNQNVVKVGDIFFCKIPKGPFQMGSRDDNLLAFNSEKPQQTFDLAYDFYISKYLVTNQKYYQLLRNLDLMTEEAFHAAFKRGEGSYPVARVSWNDARNFCHRFVEANREIIPAHLAVRLPTEAEWEKAARGQYALEWPWGDTFSEHCCNTSELKLESVSMVGHYSPLGDSPYGIADMAGNVWEWCNSLYMNYPYRLELEREDADLPGLRVVRGGSYTRDSRFARCAYRDGDDPEGIYFDVGFRIVLAPPIESLLGTHAHWMHEGEE